VPTGVIPGAVRLGPLPVASKAVIGGTIARIRSAFVRALNVSHTARQTNSLHIIPSGMASAVNPTLPLPPQRRSQRAKRDVDDCIRGECGARPVPQFAA
jgi:hypothetical protein